MRFETVRNCGKVGIEFLNVDTDGARVSRDFLTQLIFNIVRRSTDFYDKIKNPGDHVFSYRETQFHSVVCPSISDITPSFIVEHPLKRKPHGEKDYSGHVDYWISYRNYSFLMELKHTFFAYRRSHPRNTIAEKYNYAIDQLKTVKKPECRKLTLNKGLIKIAIEAIAFYEGSKYKFPKNHLRSLNFEDAFNKMLRNMRLAEKPNLRAIWLLDTRLVEPYEYSETFEIYPALAFLGKISEMID